MSLLNTPASEFVNSAEFVKRIQRLQDELPIDSYTLGNDNLWPLIRYSLGSIAVDGLPASQAGAVKHPVINRAKGITQKAWKLFTDLRLSVYGSWKDSAHNDVLRPAKNLFVTHSIRRTELNGVWYDIFFDTLIDQESSITDYLTLELVVSNSLRIPRYRKSLYTNKDLLLTSMSKSKSSHCNVLWLDEVAAKSADCFEINPIKVRNTLLSSLKAFASLKSYWQKTLNTVQPATIYLVNWYSLPHLALSSVASSKSIRVIDIQHGLQGDHHWMYGSWRLPVSGRFELLPEIFQVWGESEQKAVRAWSNNQFHRAEIVGNRWLNNSDEFFYQHGVNRQFIDFVKTQGRAVLYTHQWSDEQYFSKQVITELLKQSKAALVLIRIHPGRVHEIPLVTKQLTEAGVSNFEIANASVLPLPLLLSHVTLHITYNSSTVIEAAQKGVKSLVFDPLAERYFSEQMANGMAEIAV